MKKKVFVCGPNVPPNESSKAFFNKFAKDEYHIFGIGVSDGDDKETVYLITGIQALFDCDCAYFVEGWERSRACVVLRHICDKYGKEILQVRKLD